ncbi:MAG: asparagine synthase C-terminal domain-containing protein, partial [Rubrivivax sp.]
IAWHAYAEGRKAPITQRAWGRMQAIPAPLRQLASGALLALPARAWTGLHGMARKASARVPAYTRFGEKVHKGARAMRADNADALYLHTVSQWSDPALVVPGVAEPKSLLTGAASPLAALPDVARMMAYDTLTYLPDDILVKVDRAAMAVSLETRVPFLDHQVVEHAWRMPMSLKLRDGVGKWALREVLFRHVPRTLVERPKMGFGVPIDHWLRGPLRDWAESLLDAGRLRAEGYLAAEPIRATWQAHLDRTDDQQYALWNVLTFQAWLEQQAAGPN